jgi:ribosome maturation factor RimP
MERGREEGAAAMSATDRVRELVLPVLDERELDLYDVEQAGPVLRVVVDAPAGTGLDLDVVADATRAISRLLDEVDPIPGRYTLEVTSPGLERTLRTPEHFARAVGEKVKVKTTPNVDDGDRRVEGVLEAADPAGIAVRTGAVDAGDAGEAAVRRLRYEDIVRARTVFDWGPGPKPRGGSAGQRRTGAGTSHEKRERKR